MTVRLSRNIVIRGWDFTKYVTSVYKFPWLGLLTSNSSSDLGGKFCWARACSATVIPSSVSPLLFNPCSNSVHGRSAEQCAGCLVIWAIILTKLNYSVETKGVISNQYFLFSHILHYISRLTAFIGKKKVNKRERFTINKPIFMIGWFSIQII
jgi:hypothetical protein